MVGLRGVGKTVLLDRMREEAEAAGTPTLLVEAPEDPCPPCSHPGYGWPCSSCRATRGREIWRSGR